MSAHENVAAPASYPYPDVSLSKKICAQGKAVFSLSHGPLRFEAPEDQAVATL